MEDFNNERQDREKAQALVERLQKKLDGLSKSVGVITFLYFSNIGHPNSLLLNWLMAVMTMMTSLFIAICDTSFYSFFFRGGFS